MFNTLRDIDMLFVGNAHVGFTNQANRHVITPPLTRRMLVTCSQSVDLWVGPRNDAGTAPGTDVGHFDIAQNQTVMIPIGGRTKVEIKTGSSGNAWFEFFGGRQHYGARTRGNTSSHSLADGDSVEIDIPAQATHAIIDNSHNISYSFNTWTVGGDTVGPNIDRGLLLKPFTSSSTEMNSIEVDGKSSLHIARTTSNTTSVTIQFVYDPGRGHQLLRPIGRTLIQTTPAAANGVVNVASPKRATYLRIGSNVNRILFGNQKEFAYPNQRMASGETLLIPCPRRITVIGPVASTPVTFQFYSLGASTQTA